MISTVGVIVAFFLSVPIHCAPTCVWAYPAVPDFRSFRSFRSCQSGHSGEPSQLASGLAVPAGLQRSLPSSLFLLGEVVPHGSSYLRNHASNRRCSWLLSPCIVAFHVIKSIIVVGIGIHTAAFRHFRLDNSARTLLGFLVVVAASPSPSSCHSALPLFSTSAL